MGFADLLAFADRAAIQHLGDDAVHYAAIFGEPSGDVRGIFDPAHVHPEPGNPGVVQVGPAVFLRASDLPADLDWEHMVVTVAGAEYRVREPQTDGQGGLMLHLRKV